MMTKKERKKYQRKQLWIKILTFFCSDYIVIDFPLIEPPEPIEPDNKLNKKTKKDKQKNKQ